MELGFFSESQKAVMDMDSEDIYKLWADWMYYEAAERGYDFTAAKVAEKKYVEARVKYKEKYGIEWKNPRG